MRPPLKLLLSSAIIAFTLISGNLASAQRMALDYSAPQRPVRACVLTSPSGASSLNPYVFVSLMRSSAKPRGWDFVNPLAGPLDSATQTRWNADPLMAIQTIGSPLPKTVAAYWEVLFNASNARRLDQFDIIYISWSDLSLPAADRAALADGLKRAALRGALIWVDAPTPTTTSGFFEPPMNRGGVGTPFSFAAAPAGTQQSLSASHPLFNTPLPMAWQDIAALGSTSGMVNIASNDLVPIVAWGGSLASPSVALASVGDGGLLVTAGNLGAAIQGWVLPASTLHDLPTGTPLASAMLAYNAIAWNNRWSQARAVSSGRSASRAPVTGPLDILWQFPGPTEPNGAGGNEIGPVVSSPVVDGDLVYALSLHSQNGVPAQLICLRTLPDRQTANGQPWEYGWSGGNVALRLPGINIPFTPRWTSPALATANMLIGGRVIPVRVVLISVVDGSGSTPDGYVACFAARDNNLGPVPITGGTLLWAYQVSAYSSECSGVASPATVVDVSTPVVSNGYVYVLASEYAPGLSGAAVDKTYGRVHVFDLSTGGNVPNHAPTISLLGGAPGYRFVFPDPDLDQNGALDAGGGGGSAILPANYTPPDRRILPPFQEPAWVASPTTELPPAPTPVPCVTNAVDQADGTAAESVVLFGTPVSNAYSGGTIGLRGYASVTNRAGGCDYALVPTPYNSNPGAGAPNYTLNANYFALRTPAAPTTMVRLDDNVAIGTGATYSGTTTGTDGNTYVQMSNIQAIRALVNLAYPLASTSPYADPIVRQRGIPVEMTVGGNPVRTILPGSIRWQRPHDFATSGQTSKSVDGPVAVSAGYPATDFAGNYSGAFGGIWGLQVGTGAARWIFDDGATAGGAGYQFVPRSSPAAGDGIAYAAATRHTPTGFSNGIYGLRTQAALTIQLAPALSTTTTDDTRGIDPSSVVVRLGPGGTVVPLQSDDKVDGVGRFITFGPTTGRVVAGRPVWVTFNLETAANSGVYAGAPVEMHAVPPIGQFYYLPGLVKLAHFPVDTASVAIHTLDGATVSGAIPAEPTISTTIGGVNSTYLPTGWLDLSAATVTNITGGDAHPLPPGTEVAISYTGYSEDLHSLISVPNAARNIPLERHQVPVAFGPSASAPATSGRGVFVGTEGYSGADSTAWPSPLIAYETMLSLDVDPTTGSVTGSRSIPAVGEGSTYPSNQVPIVSSSPTINGNTVFVGSHCSPSLACGFVSALGMRRTLVCDNTRVMETVGGKPSWVCLGSRVARWGEDPAASTAEPTYIPQAFNRPAKATRLNGYEAVPGGVGQHTLIADTGNNRVIEVDERGQQVWPLGAMNKNGTLVPVDYWTIPGNARLSRPSDVWRYVTTWEDNYNNNTGAATADGIPETTYHTVIADPGNARVIDISTVLLPANGLNPIQHTRVRVLSPTHARLASNPSQMARIEYSKAQPIFHPNDTQDCIGYLCVASNLHQLVILDGFQPIVNPAPVTGLRTITYAGSGVGTVSRSAGGATWNYWSWLYNSGGAGTGVNPLIFDNIRHAEYSVVGTRQYVTVAATRYRGRMATPGAGILPAATAGPGVFEFAMDVNPATPNNWARVIPTSPSADDPIWYFNQSDYVSTNAFRLAYFTLPSGQVINKTLDPWCAKRLPDGRHLITTVAPLVEHLTHLNTPGLLGTSLGSEVFEVTTRLAGAGGTLITPAATDLDASVQQKYVDTRTVIPDPRGLDWTDPLNQPVYAERF